MTMTQEQMTALAHFIQVTARAAVVENAPLATLTLRNDSENKRVKAHAEFIRAFSAEDGA